VWDLGSGSIFCGLAIFFLPTSSTPFRKSAVNRILPSRSHALVLACAAAAAFAGFGGQANAQTTGETINLLANDAGGTTSFNTNLNWSAESDSVKRAPHAGNAYVNSSFLLRTPQGVFNSMTFAGDSLTLGDGTNRGQLSYKIEADRTVTVNNLTLNNAILVNAENTGNKTATYAGNGFTLLNGDALLWNASAGLKMIISAPISGTGDLTANGGSSTLSNVNTYTGNTIVGEAATGIIAANTAFTLADNAGLKFVIGASGTNNKIVAGTATGITRTLTLSGDFTFDLSSAGTNLGDSWQIVDNANLTETYSSTFSVVGFTETANVWDKTVSGITYSFAESTGLLSVAAVPEPASLGLLGVGAAALLLRRRRHA
jgi:hypothetical protein